MVDDAFTPIDKTVISTAVEEFDVGASLRLSNRNVCIEYMFGSITYIIDIVSVAI